MRCFCVGQKQKGVADAMIEAEAEWALFERCSKEATGELLEIERLTSSLERGHWKSTREGNSLVAYSTARPVLNGGREETCRKVTRLAPTHRLSEPLRQNQEGFTGQLGASP